MSVVTVDHQKRVAPNAHLFLAHETTTVAREHVPRCQKYKHAKKKSPDLTLIIPTQLARQAHHLHEAFPGATSLQTHCPEATFVPPVGAHGSNLSGQHHFPSGFLQELLLCDVLELRNCHCTATTRQVNPMAFLCLLLRFSDHDGG